MTLFANRTALDLAPAVYLGKLQSVPTGCSPCSLVIVRVTGTGNGEGIQLPFIGYTEKWNAQKCRTGGGGGGGGLSRLQTIYRLAAAVRNMFLGPAEHSLVYTYLVESI